MRNLGHVEEASIRLGAITVITGKNNSGKTLVSSALASFLSSESPVASTGHFSRKSITGKESEITITEEIGDVFWKTICKQATGAIRDSLPEFWIDESFSATVNSTIPWDSIKAQSLTWKYLDGLKLRKNVDSLVVYVDLTSMESQPSVNELATRLREFLGAIIRPRVAVFSPDRAGIIEFLEEILAARNSAHVASSDDGTVNSFRHSPSIESNIVESMKLKRMSVQDMAYRAGLPEANGQVLKSAIAAFADVMSGRIKRSSKSGVIVYCPSSNPKYEIPLSLASSSIKALALLDGYIRSRARVGDYLILDEPELHLHPEKQRAFAQAMVILAHFGIKIFVTTHSDYLIRELNNICLLTQHGEGATRIFGKGDPIRLDPSDFNCYIMEEVAPKDDKGPLFQAQLVPWNNLYGLEKSAFDTTLEAMNLITEEAVELAEMASDSD